MQYEIEIKSLLGSQQNVDALLKKLKEADESFKQTDEQLQLNHYFINGKLANLIQKLSPYFNAEQIKILQDIDEVAKAISVRARQKNEVTYMVVKGSLDSADANHSSRRMEFEDPIELDIEQLDDLVLAAGFELEAKWSAARKMYLFKDMTVDVMFSPGYGYVVEFEKVISDESQIEQTRQNLLALMRDFGVEELNAERLNRMFAYYNQNWAEYYGTNKVFTIN
jgi:predicted adenylyl cyclase CyaB